MEAEACSCDYDYDCVGPSVWESVWRRARKPHVCCECGEAIKPGERYQHDSGLWDGSWDHHDTCAACAAIRRDYGGCCCYGDLVEALGESLGFDYRTAGYWQKGSEHEEDMEAIGERVDEERRNRDMFQDRFGRWW